MTNLLFLGPKPMTLNRARGRVCVESPHSAAAMARFGVVEEDLLPRSVEYFLSRGDDERRAKMKADFAEKTRLRLLSTLEEERQVT